MSVCCIGGVCIPYTALLPFLVYLLKWLVEKLVACGLVPAVVLESLQGIKNKDCCSETASSISASDDDNDNALVHTIRSSAQWQALLSAHATVVCKFEADWCVPCQKLHPVYQSLALRSSTCPQPALFCRINVDDVPALPYGVAVLPTVMVFGQGKEVGRYAGSDEHKLRDLLNRHVRV